MAERTHEFMQYCSQINKGDFKKPNKVAEVTTKSAFNEAAADIAKGIHKTSGLLGNLTKLIKRQGLFDDPTNEINNLVNRIKQDLGELNTKCDSAQQYIEAKKSIWSNDTNQSSRHSVSVVNNLKTDLAHATKDFKTVLEMRQNKMKHQEARKAELSGKGLLSPGRLHEQEVRDRQKLSANDSLNATSSSNPNSNNSLALRGHGGSNPMFDSPYGNTNSDSSNGFSVPQNHEHYQQSQLLLTPINSEYFDQREKAVTEVEKTIGELGQLFQRLNGMILEQGAMVERIDEDIESTVESANNAKKVLEDLYAKASSNSGLYMKIGAILAIFALFFIIFLL